MFKNNTVIHKSINYNHWSRIDDVLTNMNIHFITDQPPASRFIPRKPRLMIPDIYNSNVNYTSAFVHYTRIRKLYLNISYEHFFLSPLPPPTKISDCVTVCKRRFFGKKKNKNKPKFYTECPGCIWQMQ